MSEQELKLHIPHAARAGVERELKRGAVTRIRLRALYFDTPSRELVQARVALRLRQEGRQWVQTLKMPGEHVLSRIEINHNRPGPVLDLSVYVGTVAEAAISGITEALAVCYETDVVRHLRKVRTRQGSVEIALDIGCLRAGKIELPISEIEFELLSGKLDAVFDLGRKWQRTHGLVLDARSKSERGDQLAVLAQKLLAIDSLPENVQIAARTAAIAQFWPARGAVSLKLSTDMSAEQALAAITLECIDQITRNAAILAEIDTAGICKAGHAEHTHQLRVGIRRLRSAWSFFNGITPLPSVELRESIKQFFSLLGGTRDDDVLNETILPVLRAAGQPPLVIAPEDNPTASQDLIPASVDFQAWLVAMLEGALLPAKHKENISARPSELAAPPHSDHADEGSSGPIDARIIPMQPDQQPRALTLKQALVLKLRKWHKQVLRDGLKFDQLDIEPRHELRKRAKKLRYALQFSEALLPASRLKNYRKQLSAVQDILGEMNDLAVARQRFVGLRDTQPSAWFACGWITSRLDALVLDATDAFKQLEKTETFWR